MTIVFLFFAQSNFYQTSLKQSPILPIVGKIFTNPIFQQVHFIINSPRFSRNSPSPTWTGFTINQWKVVPKKEGTREPWNLSCNWVIQPAIIRESRSSRLNLCVCFREPTILSFEFIQNQPRDFLWCLIHPDGIFNSIILLEVFSQKLGKKTAHKLYLYIIVFVV